MSDDGFHEIQLNGKQLVFLFMAATVVAVVIFLCGVMVGRGVPTRAAAPNDSSEQAALDPTASVRGSVTQTTATDDNAPVAAQETLTYPTLLEDPNPPFETLAPLDQARGAPSGSRGAPAAEPRVERAPLVTARADAPKPVVAPSPKPAAAAPAPKPAAAAPKPAAPKPAAPGPKPVAAGAKARGNNPKACACRQRARSAWRQRVCRAGRRRSSARPGRYHRAPPFWQGLSRVRHSRRCELPRPGREIQRSPRSGNGGRPTPARRAVQALDHAVASAPGSRELVPSQIPPAAA